MQTSAAVMRSLAAMAIIAFSISTVAAAEKVSPCCTRVSRSRVEEPIKNFTIQERNPPCVNAIIFETEKDRYCLYMREPWVQQKVKELRKARKTNASLTTASLTTASLTTATLTTDSLNTDSLNTDSLNTDSLTTASPNSESPDLTSSTILS